MEHVDDDDDDDQYGRLYKGRVVSHDMHREVRDVAIRGRGGRPPWVWV